jgi:hypothetical protein
VNIYGLFEKLADGLEREVDKKAAKEVIEKLAQINAFGSAAREVESDTDETVHEHIIETTWDNMNAGKVVDICRECHQRVGAPYDPRYVGGNSQYFRR